MLYPQISLIQFLSLICRKFIKYIPLHESQPQNFSSSVSFAFFSIDFRKQDYFFWPEYNVWKEHWIRNYLMQGSPNTLIYFKSKSFFYLVRDFSNIFFFLRHDFKITGKVVQVFSFTPKQPPFQDDYGSIWKRHLLKESLSIFKSRE